jgi:inosine-uridine nucleoside N-ribohydrolase
MGGCGNAHGNATRVAEFNVKADVTAAAHVFEHWRGEMTVVSWDLCCGNPIPWRSFHEAVSKELHEGEVGKFLKAICRDIYSSEKDADKRSGEGAVICDFLAVAVAIDRTVVRRWEVVNVEVETGGSITEGMTVVDWGCYDGVKGREKNVEWVTAVDMGRVVEMLGMTVKGGGGVCED